jgi:hypothetical protein
VTACPVCGAALALVTEAQAATRRAEVINALDAEAVGRRMAADLEREQLERALTEQMGGSGRGKK